MSSRRVAEDVPVVEFDFDTEFPDDAAAGVDALALTNKKRKRKSKSGSNSPDIADPVVISTSNKDLHELLQSPQYHAYNLTAVFDFDAAETDHGLKGFTVRMRLESKTAGVVKELSPEGCFPSKKLAKEVAAGMALEYLKELPVEIAQLPRAESAVGSARSDDPVESVNWVDMLQSACCYATERVTIALMC
jgi:FlaA1/EpsC-like NDP-sugar epimerase